MNGPCFVTGQHVIDLTEFGFNDTSILVGLFVSSRRGREKRIGDSKGDEREGQGRKDNE